MGPADESKATGKLRRAAVQVSATSKLRLLHRAKAPRPVARERNRVLQVCAVLLAAAGCVRSDSPNEAQVSNGARQTGQRQVETLLEGPDLSAAPSAEWALDQQQSRAVLRLGNGPELFSISCAAGKLFFRRHTAAPHKGNATLSLKAGRDGASLPAKSNAADAGPSSFWEAEVRTSDLPSSVLRIIGSTTPVTIAVGETAPLVAQPSEAPGEVIEKCS